MLALIALVKSIKINIASKLLCEAQILACKTSICLLVSKVCILFASAVAGCNRRVVRDLLSQVLKVFVLKLIGLAQDRVKRFAGGSLC